MVVSAGNAEAVEAVAAPVAAQKGASEIFHEALASLGGMDVSRQQVAVDDLVKKLRAAGPEGLQVVRDFFRAGQDVKLQGGYSTRNGKMTQSPSLRMSMLDALAEWPGAEATELTREVLRTTSRMAEAAMAIRQLEAKAPGAYRAEAIATLQQLANGTQGKDGIFDGGNSFFDALGYFKAAEMLPAAEKLVQKNGWAASQYLQALANFSPDVRGPAMERVFAQPEAVKQMASNPWALQNLNYSERAVSQNVAQMFADSMDKKARENFLTNFAANRSSFTMASAFDPASAKGVVAQPVPEATRVAQLQSKLVFLDSIAPQCNTPVLQERLQDARDDVKKAISQVGLVKTGAGTLQLGGTSNMIIQSTGTTVIQGQTIDVRSGK